MRILQSTANRPLWVIPLIAASAWFTMLWVMLIYYLAVGRPFYPSMEGGNLAYISDIGAFKLKPLFIVFCVLTSLFFFLSLLAMRFHQSLTTRYERVLDLCALLSGALGSVGLILLSIFDTHNHGPLHGLFLFFFMFGVCLSALFSTLEYYRLGKTFTEHPILKWSFRGKAAVFVVEIVLCVAFAVLMRKRRQNQAAALEWVIAFVFTCYLGTFVLDLLPRARTKEELGREMGLVKGRGGEMRERREGENVEDGVVVGGDERAEAAEGPDEAEGTREGGQVEMQQTQHWNPNLEEGHGPRAVVTTDSPLPPPPVPWNTS